MTSTVDCVVAGAGPAGLSAAAALALAGLSVQVFDSPLEMDASVLVGRRAIVGVQRTFEVRESPPGLEGVDHLTAMFDGPTRSVHLPHARAAIVEYAALLDWLRAIALDAGALFRHARVSGFSPTAHGWECEMSDSSRVRSLHLIDATGVGLAPSTPPAGSVRGPAGIVLGHAEGTRIWRRAASWTEPTYLFATSSDDDTAGRRPVTVRLIPRADGSASVTATVPAAPEGRAGDLVSLVLDAAIDAFPDLGLEPVGAGPIASRELVLSPARLGDATVIQVGGAAGLTNWITGDGLDSALDSGIWAADAIISNRSSSAAALSAYHRTLRRAMTSQNTASTQFIRRHVLSRRILVDSAHLTMPLFSKGRRALLLPSGADGVMGHYSDAARLISGRDSLVPFEIACNEIAVNQIRDWPMVARALANEMPVGATVRLSTLFGASILIGGSPQPSDAYFGAALDLAFSALLAMFDPGEQRTSRGVSWPIAASIIAADYQMASAISLVAQRMPQLVDVFTEWIMDLAICRMSTIGGPDTVFAPVSGPSLFARVLEFPAAAGAQLSTADHPTVKIARSIGRDFGQLFTLVEHLLAVRGRPNRTELPLAELSRLRLLEPVTDSDSCVVRWLPLEPEVLDHRINDTATGVAEQIDRLPSSSRFVMNDYLQAILSPLQSENGT